MLSHSELPTRFLDDIGRRTGNSHNSEPEIRDRRIMKRMRLLLGPGGILEYKALPHIVSIQIHIFIL